MRVNFLQTGFEMMKWRRTLVRHTAGRLAVWLVVFASLSVAVTRAARHPIDSAIPTGPDGMTTVPLFNTWTIWWNADRALHGFEGYWTAPIFHPEPGTFAFSEPQPATLLVAPLVWAGGSRAVAYNAYLHLSLVLNGLTTAILLWSLRRGMLVSTLGGAAMVLLPIVFLQLEAIQVVPLWGILWTWHALRKLGAAPDWRRGVETGLAFATSFALCIHHGLFLSLLLAGTGWILVCRRRILSRVMHTALAAAVGIVLTLPLLHEIAGAMKAHEFDRPTEVVRGLSAQPRDFWATPPGALLASGNAARHSGYRLSVGWLKTGLAVVGVVLALVRRRGKRWTLFLAATAVVAAWLAMGPNLRLGSWQPWSTLAEWCPGIAQVRNVFRFAYFTQMATVLLAMDGLYSLSLWRRRFIRRRRSAIGATVILVALGIAAVLEAVPPAPPRIGVPSAEANRGWIDFVRRETPDGAGIACIPFAPGTRAEDFDMTVRWMYYGTYHGVPLVNGYSGWFPKSYWKLRAAVRNEFPSAAALNRLAEHDVEFVVALRAQLPRQNLAEFPSVGLRLRLVHEDPAGVDVYRLEEMPGE